MKHLVISVILLATARFCQGGPIRLQKRAAFYIANETACVVDNLVYSNGDPIPTDDPCEACRCRPPGFACVLLECEVKPGCRAVRRTGYCCPEYVCETNTSEVNTTSLAIKPNSDVEVTTISGIPTETSPSPDEPIEVKAPSEPAVEPEAANPIHFIADAINEEHVPETHERGSNTESHDEKDTITTIQPIQKEDSDKVQDDTGETGDKLDLLNSESDLKEPIEEPKENVDESSLESTTANPDIAVSFETTVSKANVEIFTDETTQEHKFDASTVSTTLPSNDPKTTEVPVTREETEIETNVIEKKFRSLENTSLENTKSEVTENEQGTPTHTESVSTEVPEEKTSTFQEIATSIRVQEIVTSTTGPETDSSEAVKPKDTTISDQTTIADKSLYYKPEEKILEALGTVSAMVVVHEATSPENAVMTSTPLPSSIEENLSLQTDIPKETIGDENVDKAFSEIPN